VHLQTRSISASKCSSQFTRSRPPIASPNSLDHGLKVHLWVHSTSASQCISKLDRSRPPSASLSLLYFGLQVNLQTRSITAFQCISKLDRSRPASAFLRSLNLGLQVHLQTSTITASKYIIKEWRWVYGDTGVTEVESAMRSIYSGDPRVDRQHPIFISSCHTTKIHTLSFPTFGLTRSLRDFVDPRNCVDPYALQSRCKRVHNEPIPTYGHSWPQRQSVCLK